MLGREDLTVRVAADAGVGGDSRSAAALLTVVEIFGIFVGCKAVVRRGFAVTSFVFGAGSVSSGSAQDFPTTSQHSNGSPAGCCNGTIRHFVHLSHAAQNVALFTLSPDKQSLGGMAFWTELLLRS